ncbi:MAG: T9SS type A sorting domain-containing protein [Saprospiraceae bacterium]
MTPKKVLHPIFYVLLFFFCSGFSTYTSAQISISSFGTALTEDFNTLAFTGTSSTLPAGWALSEAGTNANTTYTAGTGSLNTGDTWSYGATSSTERAFGGLRSGTLIPTLGASFTNNAGAIISTLSISYKGEQWRLGAVNRVDQLDFQYSTNATSLTTGTWTDVNALDFTAPVVGPTVGALNGNVLPNFTVVNSSISNLSISNGATFWLRWNDLDATGADDGLAIDSFSLKACPSVTCPGNSSVCINTNPFVLTGGSPAGGVYSGPGVSGGVFNPASAGTGMHNISYNYNNGTGCTGSCSYTITVNGLPSIVPGTVPDVCQGNISGTLPYSGLMNGANQYSIDYSSGANSIGFVDITNAALPASPIPLVIPAGAPSFTYTANLIVRNSTTTCQSAPIPIMIRIVGCLAAPSMEWVLLNDNHEVNGTCVSHSDCDNNVICYALRYVPNHTGDLTSYTTGFLSNCTTSGSPLIDTSNRSCVMSPGASAVNNMCAALGMILFNSSANGPNVPIVQNVPVILHQVCFTIPAGQSITITEDVFTDLTTSINVTGGGFVSEFPAYTPLTINRNNICGLLPLTWLSFHAVKYGELMSALSWTTTDELNNAYFEIQRSTDFGHTFQVIGRVDAVSNAKAINAYEFIDRNASAGKNLYRIMQVDYDDRSSYSSIASVSFTSNTFRVQAWPNPASDELNVSIHAAAGMGLMSLFDLTGRLVYQKKIEPGEGFETIQVSDLRPGIYSLLVEDGTNHHVEKIVVMD